MLEHLVARGEAGRALALLRRPGVPQELTYKFSPALVAAAPAEAVEAWMAAQPALNPRRARDTVPAEHGKINQPRYARCATSRLGLCESICGHWHTVIKSSHIQVSAQVPTHYHHVCSTAPLTRLHGHRHALDACGRIRQSTAGGCCRRCCDSARRAHRSGGGRRRCGTSSSASCTCARKTPRCISWPSPFTLCRWHPHPNICPNCPAKMCYPVWLAPLLSVGYRMAGLLETILCFISR